MSQTMKLVFIAMLIIAVIISPAMGANDNGKYPNGNDKGNNGNGNGNGNSDITVDVNNVNNNDVNQEQNQYQNQNQNQEQNQEQKQSQSNIQIVTVASTSGSVATSSTHLDVGDSQEYSRLVYPGEVIVFGVSKGDVVTMKASSDVALYTIGTYAGDDLRICSSTSAPVYDPVYHRFDFGTVVPVDKIDCWTMKATLIPSGDAKFIVVDNRAPMNGYTHIELVITNGNVQNI